MVMTQSTAVFADITPIMDNQDLYERYYRSISPDRQQKTDRYRFAEGRCLSVAASWAVIYAFRLLGIEVSDWEYTCTDLGKPYFSQRPDLHFNISHSHRRVLCIAGYSNVGCDVEQIGTKSLLDIAKRVFTPQEYHLITHLSNQEDIPMLFTRIWTLKESYMKCTGLGFSLSPSTFQVMDDSGLAQPYLTNGQDVYDLFEYTVPDGYCYSCCFQRASSCPERPVQPSLQRIDLSIGPCPSCI